MSQLLSVIAKGNRTIRRPAVDKLITADIFGNSGIVKHECSLWSAFIQADYKVLWAGSVSFPHDDRLLMRVVAFPEVTSFHVYVSTNRDQQGPLHIT